MLRVYVRFVAILREWIGVRAEWTTLAEGSTVAELWRAYAARHPRAQTARVAYAVNRKLVAADHVLRDGDHVDVLPPISGGVTAARADG